MSTTRKRYSRLQDDEGDGSSTESPQSHSLAFRIFQGSISALITTYRSATTFSSYYEPGAPYSTVLHSKPWVYYRGSQTYVPFSVLGARSLSKDRKIILQRRGWRTGLLGWKLGSLLGGLGKDKQTDVTPQTQSGWSSYTTATTNSEENAPTLSKKQKNAYDGEIQSFLTQQYDPPKDHKPLETDLVRIPVVAGDGYFRLAVESPKDGITSSSTPVTYSSTFRVGSLSLSSAQPRGASPATLVPELLLRTVSLSAWGAFWALFPVFKVAEMIPGPSSRFGQWAINRAWSSLGGEQKIEEMRGKYKIDERRQRAGEQLYRNVPFGSAGIRTVYDLKEDQKLGRGGVTLVR